MEVQLYAFLTLTLRGGETGEKAPSTHSIRSLDILETCLCQKSNNSSTVKVYYLYESAKANVCSVIRQFSDCISLLMITVFSVY